MNSWTKTASLPLDGPGDSVDCDPFVNGLPNLFALSDWGSGHRSSGNPRLVHVQSVLDPSLCDRRVRGDGDGLARGIGRRTAGTASRQRNYRADQCCEVHFAHNSSDTRDRWACPGHPLHQPNTPERPNRHGIHFAFNHDNAILTGRRSEEAAVPPAWQLELVHLTPWHRGDLLALWMR